MKLSHVLQKLLANKTVLNIVAGLSAFNMIGYLVLGKLTAILFFIVLAILITHFSKNMIIVLGVPLILVNLFVVMGLSNIIEGMENKTEGETDKTEGETGKTEGETGKTEGEADKTKGEADKTEGEKEVKKEEKKEESFEVGRAKRRGAGSQIDYASTVEDAYDQLNSILGSDGIKNLTADTQKLMKQQMNLASSMKDIGPMIEGLGPMMKQAQDLLGGMEGKGMGDIMEMAKKFTQKK